MTVGELTFEERIVANATAWVGTRFVYGARRKGKGVDCAKMVLGIFKDEGAIPVGVEPPHLSPGWIYGRMALPENHRYDFRDFLRKWGNELPFGERHPADVISFYWNGVESHVAILVHDDCVIHADAIKGRVVRQRLSCLRSVCAVYRLKGR